jgi:glycosyltransferase involved in cell wall biosynthesis
MLPLRRASSDHSERSAGSTNVAVRSTDLIVERDSTLQDNHWRRTILAGLGRETPPSTAASADLSAESANRPAAPDRRRRVALVTLAAVDQYAVPQIVTQLLRRASDEIDFVVISQRLADDLRGRVEWHRVPIPLSIPFRLRYPLFVLYASFALRRVEADLKHTFGARPLVLQRVDLATVQFSHVVHYEIAPEQDNPLLRGAIRALERWCYRSGRVGALAAPSVRAKLELERQFPDVEVVVVPNGVDTDRFRPDTDARAAVRAQEGVRDEEVVAVFVGRAWHGKGLDIALRAVAQVFASGVSLRLWIVGDDTEEAIGLARRLGLEQQARFFGRRADVERLLQGGDVFLFPSLTETFGLACFEAAATGLPIVSTRVGGVEEILAGSDAGLIVERTPVAFADALAQLASNPGLRSRMGLVARERAMAFGWDRAAEALLEAYRVLLDVKESAAR